MLAQDFVYTDVHAFLLVEAEVTEATVVVLLLVGSTEGLNKLVVLFRLPVENVVFVA